MISLEKSKILTPFQKLPKNVRDLGKIIAAKGFEKLRKVNKNCKIWSHCYLQNVKRRNDFIFCIKTVFKKCAQKFVAARPR